MALRNILGFFNALKKCFWEKIEYLLSSLAQREVNKKNDLFYILLYYINVGQ